MTFSTRKRRPQRGFTLLEVMVAIALLSMGMMVLLDSQVGSMKMAFYTKQLTVATQLARAKMAMLQQQIQDRKLRFGLSKSVCKNGDFNEEGATFKMYTWKYCIKKVEFAIPTTIPGLGGSGSSDSSGDGADKAKGLQASALLSTLGIPAGGSSSTDLLGSLGPFMGIIQTQMKAIFKQLQESLREIQVEIIWKNGDQPQKLSVVTHLFNFNDQTGLPDGWPEQPPGGAPAAP